MVNASIHDYQGIADCVKTYANGWRIAAKVFTGK